MNLCFFMVVLYCACKWVLVPTVPSIQLDCAVVAPL